MRQHRNKLAIAVMAIGTVVVLYVTGALPKLPDAEEVITSVAVALGPWSYLLVGVAAFLETGAFVGLIAPGETIVLVGGVVAGQGEISVVSLIGLVWLCSMLGDTASFFTGRRLGRDFLLRHGPRFRIDRRRLEQVEDYFARHGGKTILIGRFVGLVRAVSPFVAGSSGLSYRRFLPFSALGCGLWSSLFTLLGFLFYRSFDRVSAIAGQATLAFGVTVAIVVGAVYAYRRLRHEEQRARLAAWFESQGSRPTLRPLVMLVRPVWRRILRPLGKGAAPRVRFLGQRLTPGDLGLELTSALLVAGVGAYVFALYTSLLVGGPRLTPADRELLNLGDKVRTEVGVDVVNLVTGFGSLATVAALVMVVSVALVVRGYRRELPPLLAGAVLIYVGVQLGKAGIDRPRPSLPVVGADGSSFPSGHAAYSTIWTAAAIALARAYRGVGKGTAFVLTGLAMTTAIGLSRVYLRVHYWSDVAGGWALGAGTFGLCAGIALIATRVRHNGLTASAAKVGGGDRA